MSRIKVVFFDAAGTLFHVKGSVGDIYLRHAEKYGVSNSPEIRDKVNAAFARAMKDAPPAIFAQRDPAELKRCERLWWFDLVHTVFYRVGMFEGFDDFFEEVFLAFDGAQHWNIYPETVEVLHGLKGQGYELGIISNFDTRIFNVLRGLGLKDLFDTVTISSLAQAAKPATKIFHLALDEHVVDPHEAVHVGDSLTEDLKGATDSGLEGVWVDRDSEGKQTLQALNIRGHYMTTLRELPDILSQVS